MNFRNEKTSEIIKSYP